jgi:SsrA-binding protein
MARAKRTTVDRQHAQEGTFAANRRASYDYDLLKTFEAGLVLTGTEIKAIREGKANIREAYARVEGGEAWLLNMHIAPYSKGGGFATHEPTRRRKLLLHAAEIGQLAGAQDQKGFTVIPTRLYLKRGRAKIELAIARGRRAYDKREAIAKRDAEREMARAVRHAERGD